MAAKKNKAKINTNAIKQDAFFEKNYGWLLLLILIITGLIYSNSLGNGFTSFDDQSYIVDNPYLKDISVEGIGNIFTSFYAANYHPLTTLMWAIEYQLLGSEPYSFHLINLLIHLFNIVLVFYFVKVLVGRHKTALIVAFLFAVHPMHVESVSWISERKDLLYTFFYLLSLVFYLKYLNNTRSLKFLIAAFLMFLFSALSKSAAVTLPLILLLLDYYKQRALNKKNILEKVPFLLLSVLIGILALLSQSTTMSASFAPGFTLFERVFLASWAVAYYFVMSVIPFNFSALHYYPARVGGHLPLEYYAAVFFIIAVFGTLYKARKHRRLMITGIGFFIITISLVLQIIPVGQAIVSERYTYVPYIGLFIVFAEMLVNSGATLRRVLTTILLCLVIFCSYSTYQRNKVWKNSLTLFKDVYNKYPDDFYSSYALGNAYKEFGNAENAIKYYSVSIGINDAFADSYNNRGFLRNQTGDYDGAILDFSLALECEPPTCFIYFNRGMAYMNKSEYEKAVSDFSAAIDLKDDFTDAFIYRGNALSAQNNYEAALKDFDKAVSLDSSNGLAYSNRGTTKYFLNSREDACADWNVAVSLGFEQAEKMIQDFCNK